MTLWKWLAGVQVLMMVGGASGAAAQEARRRTVLVAPDGPAEQAPEVAVHTENSTALVFEEDPKAVKLEGAEGRFKVDQIGKVVTLLPLQELGSQERLLLRVTAADGARFSFNVVDGLSGDVDSQVTVRRARDAAAARSADAILPLLMSQGWEELGDIRYEPGKDLKPGTLCVKGTVHALGFAILLVSAPGDVPQTARFHVIGHRPKGASAAVVGVQRDKSGFKVAVQLPPTEPADRYTLELQVPGRATTVVASGLTF